MQPPLSIPPILYSHFLHNVIQMNVTAVANQFSMNSTYMFQSEGLMIVA